MELAEKQEIFFPNWGWLMEWGVGKWEVGRGTGARGDSRNLYVMGLQLLFMFHDDAAFIVKL